MSAVGSSPAGAYDRAVVAIDEDPKVAIGAPRWKRAAGDWTLTLEEGMCQRLRELPEWSNRDPDDVAEGFLEERAKRWLGELGGVATGTELRVVVDQYSRQAFVIDGATIVHIESF